MIETRYIFLTGGVISSLGKGIIISSLASLLKSYGIERIRIIKIDPYLNLDPGTMSPYQHGEVYVTDSGDETDLDLGNYERFTGLKMSGENNYTSGQIFSQVLEKERRGEYLGQTVQIVPHLTNHIKYLITKNEHEYQFVLIEVGGTVGDIESQWFLEAIRQLLREKKHNSIVIHLSLIPYLRSCGELKTKPTQHSTKDLMSQGIIPDIIICRSELDLSKELKDKIALFCNVDPDSVFEAVDLENVYQMPSHLANQNLPDTIFEKLLYNPPRPPNLLPWINFQNKIAKSKSGHKIGIIGKYVNHEDSYKSLIESIKIAGYYLEKKVEITLLDARTMEIDELEDKMKLQHGIIVPGGFGYDGIPGKMLAIQIARENKIPFLGICLGFQLAVIEYGVNKLGISHLTSAEWNPRPDDRNMVEIIKIINPDCRELGGTMRLGSRELCVEPDTLAHLIYESNVISERHRHRYDIDRRLFKHYFENSGLRESAFNTYDRLIEIVELNRQEHPFFIATQFHPEYRTTIFEPHPLFLNLLQH